MKTQFRERSRNFENGCKLTQFSMFKSILLSLYNDTQENFKRLVTLVAPVTDNISSISRVQAMRRSSAVGV